MQVKCKNCELNFVVSEMDKAFYTKMRVPLSPSLCPHCRQQRRAMIRNETSLYIAVCAKNGQSMISMYKLESEAVVYSPESWWSDDWNPLDYGQNFDFSRRFFEQYRDLQLMVPRLAMYQKNSENSQYANHADSTKNAYLCAGVAMSEDTFYSKWIIGCKDVIDCYKVEDSSLCYESLLSKNSYNSKYLFQSNNSQDSDFLYNCKNVKNSIMCWNLRNKEYCIKNYAYSKEDYEKVLSQYDTGSYRNLQAYVAEFEKLKPQIIRKASEQNNCENCSGDFLSNCKNCQECFGIADAIDCNYNYDGLGLKDCFDTYQSGFECELQYETHACNRGRSLISCSASYDVSNCYYCEMCHNSSNLFGCIGLRHKEYCIFNKQYSKEDYFALVRQIVIFMRQTQEWGEFFPPALSFFAYNESTVPDFVTLSKAEVLAHGWGWYDSKQNYLPQSYLIPDHIQDIPDSICNEVLSCESCQKNYKIIKQELELYRKQNLAIPRICQQCRHLRRTKLKNPYKLNWRKCQQCQKNVKSTYPLNSTEIIYCEQCYLGAVY